MGRTGLASRRRCRRPFAGELRTLREEGVPYAVQYTTTGLGTDVEPKAPNRTHVIEDFRTVSRDLPDPGCIQWRYDPIVLSERYTPAFHRENFTGLARALAGATRVVNTSIVEPYLRAVRRMDPSVCYRAVDPDRHKTVAKRYPDLPEAREHVLAPLIRELAEIADRFGMELRACSNPEWILPASQCVGPQLFAGYGTVADAIAAQHPGPSRPACGCVKTVDIGMDDRCVAGCTYCYAVNDHEAAIRRYRSHDPSRPLIR